MRAHIWLGLWAVPLIVLHSGLQLGGRLSIVLMVLFIVVIISGIFGLLLQQVLPRVMLRRVPAETIYSQIDHVAEQLYFMPKTWWRPRAARTRREQQSFALSGRPPRP